MLSLPIPRRTSWHAAAAWSISGAAHVLLAGVIGHFCALPREWWQTQVARGEPIVLAMSEAAPNETLPVQFLAEAPPLQEEDAQSPAELPVDAQPLEVDRQAPPHPLGAEPIAATAANPPQVVSHSNPPRIDPLRDERPRVEPPTHDPPPRQQTDAQPRSSLAMVAVEPIDVGAAVDELPRKLRTNPAPAYPAEALAAGIEGRVVIRVLVSAAGMVRRAAIDASSGAAALDASALAAVERWRFSPARRRGAAVEYEVLVPVRFTIRRG